MKPTKSIIYIGNDEGIWADIQTYCKSNFKSLSIEKYSYVEGIIVTITERVVPHLIIIENVPDVTTFTKELLLIKRYQKFKSIPVAVLCKDNEEIKLSSHLHTLGVHLFFVKGGDLELFLEDCCYIAFNEKINPRLFATAKDLDLKVAVGACSTIAAVTADTLRVESDVDFKTSEIKLSNLPFYEHPGITFKVINQEHMGFSYHTLESYQLAYPFAGPWDSPTSETISANTIETWLSLYENEFETQRPSIFIYSDYFKLVGEFVIPNINKVNAEFFDSVQEKSAGYLEEKMPALLVFELNELINLDVIYKFISEIRNIFDYSPIIVVLNSPSSSEALRKIFNFEKIIASSSKISSDLLSQLTQRFLNKTTDHHIATREMRSNDPRRSVYIMSEISIMSLSEHEVTFNTTLEIPYFSTLALSLPLPSFVTVVPSLYKLYRPSDKFSYMGIIHGLNEEDFKSLRIIVNQLIYRPMKELSPQIVLEMLNQNDMTSTTQAHENFLDPLPAETTEVELAISNISTRHVVERKTIKGCKSKL